LQFFDTADDVFEVKNVSDVVIDLTRLTIIVDGTVHNVASRSATLAPGAFVTLSSSDVRATVGLAGIADLEDSGGTIEAAIDGEVTDTVVVANVVDVDAIDVIARGDFVASGGVSVQLDSTQASAVGNDDANAWCLSFRADNSFDRENHPCRGSAVINELSYDAPGTDDGTTFVEVAAPVGAVILDLAVRQQGVGGNGGIANQGTVTITGARMGGSAVYVIADDAGGGVTSVENADQLANFDPQNGPNDGVAILDGAAVLDALGYGADAGPVAEGTPAQDPTPLGSGHVFSLARDARSTDTNDNAADFRVNPAPSPGRRNVAPDLSVTVDPEVVVAFTDTDVAVTVSGGGTFGGDEPTITIGGVDVECIYVEHSGDVAEFLCELPARDGSTGSPRALPEGLFADVVFQQPVAIGGVIESPEGLLIEEGSANESDLEIEADFCNIQFPVDDITIALGEATPLIFSQIFEDGLTTGGGQAPGVVVEFGLSRLANPTRLSDFVFAPGPVFNVEVGNNDEYSHSVTPPAEGTFRFLFRYSLDGGLNWTACDENGAGSNPDLSLEFENAGTIIVGPPN
jgi:hypothetical protein